MDVSPERIDALRPDAHRLVLGILWSFALGLLVLSPHDDVDAARYVDTIGAQLTHVTIPVFLAALLGVLLCLLIPYCLGAAFQPLSLGAANGALKLERRLRSETADEIGTAAHTLIVKLLGATAAIGRDGITLYLRISLPALAEQLDRRQSQLDFRALSLLPASIILGRCASGIMPSTVSSTWRLASAAIVTLGVFTWGIFIYNDHLRRLQDAYAAAAYLAALQQSRRSSVQS